MSMPVYCDTTSKTFFLHNPYKYINTSIFKTNTKTCHKTTIHTPITYINTQMHACQLSFSSTKKSNVQYKDWRVVFDYKSAIL